MGDVNITVEGLEQVKAKLKALREKYPAAAAAALKQEALATMADSIRRVPVDEGRLRATAYVAPVEGAGAEASVEFGYGTDYGIYVHERTELRHAVGEAKFLEKAIAARAGNFAETLAARIKSNVENWTSLDLGGASFPTEPQDPGPGAGSGFSKKGPKG